MAGAFWGIVEDDRQGNPKKVMAEVLGEAIKQPAGGVCGFVPPVADEDPTR